MKYLLLVVLMSSLTIGFSQIKDDLTDTLEAEQFWTDNIRNIIEGNRQKILEQTHFPLMIKSEWVEKEEFSVELEKHFTERIRAELKASSYKRVKGWYVGDDPTLTYMVPCLEIADREDSLFSTTESGNSGRFSINEGRQEYSDTLTFSMNPNFH